MCGFIGCFTFDSSKRSVLDIDRVTRKHAFERIRYRGRDSDGIFEDTNVLLIHSRLAIHDVSSNGAQPFLIDSGRYALAFNGEIYNYPELKKILLATENIHFQGSSDTEVLAYWLAYAKTKTPEAALNGDWSFCFYDKLKRTILLSRDRYGSKPLYIKYNSDAVYFGSDPLSLLILSRETLAPNIDQIGDFLSYGSGFESLDTWFQGIFRLAPSSSILFNSSGSKQIYNYYHRTFGDTPIDYPTHCSEYLSLLSDSVRLRLSSDRGIALALSSGIDSSSIAYLASSSSNKLNTYTLSLENSNEIYKGIHKSSARFSDSSFLPQLTDSLNLDSYLVNLPNNHDVLLSYSDFVRTATCPHTSHTTLFLSSFYQAVSQTSKVILEGQGADELLAGYTIRHFFPLILTLLQRNSYRRIVDETIKHLSEFTLSSILQMGLRSQFFPLSSLIKSSLPHQNFVGGYSPLLRLAKATNQSRNDSKALTPMANELLSCHTTGLVNLLAYGDLLSMSSGVESRNPFIDHRLVDFISQFDASQFVSKGYGKYFHRICLAESGFPLPNLLWNRTKLGFPSPLSAYFGANSRAYHWLYDRLSSPFYDGLLSKKSLIAVLESGSISPNKIYRLVGILLWEDLFFK
jgi:asparagine synthase (glutamine-hydrolysing)